MNRVKIDKLTKEAVFGGEKEKARLKIRKKAEEKGIVLSSTYNLYKARAQEKIPLNFTVPAINIRGMTYDVAQSVFKVANKKKVGALIFEIAKSEMEYTDQSPSEYAAVIMAAALHENYQGPLFLQGDHFQIKEEKELFELKKLIQKSIKAGFYNIDIDISTLVDYSKNKIKDQQKPNYKISAEVANHIRKIEPNKITISLGGEIGHIGGKNSTIEELEIFIEGFNKSFQKENGLSKIAIQSGSYHGGIPLPKGGLIDVKIDFNLLKSSSKKARKYNIGGIVQHGASTLPKEIFKKFPKNEVLEVHLATNFQNIILDHPSFPEKLLKKVYNWLNKEKNKENQTDYQFRYQQRKKAWGKFKKDFWEISEKRKEIIKKDLEKSIAFIFKNLNVENTKKMVREYNKNN